MGQCCGRGSSERQDGEGGHALWQPHFAYLALPDQLRPTALEAENRPVARYPDRSSCSK